MKTKRPAVDHNANGIAMHGRSVSIDSASWSGARPESVFSHYCGGEENVRQSGLNDQRHPNSALSTASDSSMRVLWSGQVAVNGSEICAAELVSRCHIRDAL